MGLNRWFLKSTVVGKTVNTAINMVEEHSIVKGVKKSVKEELCEDNPITSRVYKAGIYDGKVMGYVEASNEYEEKLLKQSDEFLKQKKVYESERDAYDKLLDEYEAEIESLSEKVNRTEIENNYLQQLILRDRKLRRLVY